MTTIQYYIHLLINSRLKTLYILITYIFVLFVYSLYFHEFVILECMNQNTNETNLPTIVPRIDNTVGNIYRLTSENEHLCERINILESALRNSLEQQINDRAHYNNTISLVLEENQRLRDDMFLLRQLATENNNVVGRLLQENAFLRSRIEQSDLYSNVDID